MRSCILLQNLIYEICTFQISKRLSVLFLDVSYHSFNIRQNIWLLFSQKRKQSIHVGNSLWYIILSISKLQSIVMCHNVCVINDFPLWSSQHLHSFVCILIHPRFEIILTCFAFFSPFRKQDIFLSILSFDTFLSSLLQCLEWL